MWTICAGWQSGGGTRARACGVNVNTTDATTGATALLLPAQNTHTFLHSPYMTPYETRSNEHARARRAGAWWREKQHRLRKKRFA